jgi:hypothetical protein
MSNYEDKNKRIEKLADDSSHEEIRTPRVGWRLPDQNYRPMHNMVTGYLKKLPPIGTRKIPAKEK